MKAPEAERLQVAGFVAGAWGRTEGESPREGRGKGSSEPSRKNKVAELQAVAGAPVGADGLPKSFRAEGLSWGPVLVRFCWHQMASRIGLLGLNFVVQHGTAKTSPPPI